MMSRGSRPVGARWCASRCCTTAWDNPGFVGEETDKVFVVCDELEDCERFLRARPDRCRALLPWFYVDKWSKYRWNYERIDASAHEAFAQRMADEYAARGKQASSICSCSILSVETFSANCSTAGRRSSQPTIRKHIRKLS